MHRRFHVLVAPGDSLRFHTHRQRRQADELARLPDGQTTFLLAATSSKGERVAWRHPLTGREDSSALKPTCQFLEMLAYSDAPHLRGRAR